MKVFLSTTARRKVYHKKGCYHLKQIKGCNKKDISMQNAINRGYGPCKYCGGLAGELRIDKKANGIASKYEIETNYNDGMNILYIRTQGGFWKLIESSKDGQILLYHANKFSTSKSDKELRRGTFHRQKEVNGFMSLHQIVFYVIFHDQNKKKTLRGVGSKKPKYTTEQKKEYKRAKRSESRESFDWRNEV